MPHSKASCPQTCRQRLPRLNAPVDRLVWLGWCFAANICGTRPAGGHLWLPWLHKRTCLIFAVLRLSLATWLRILEGCRVVTVALPGPDCSAKGFQVSSVLTFALKQVIAPYCARWRDLFTLSFQSVFQQLRPWLETEVMAYSGLPTFETPHQEVMCGICRRAPCCQLRPPWHGQSKSSHRSVALSCLSQ